MKTKDQIKLQKLYEQIQEPYTEDARSIWKLHKELVELGEVPKIGDPEWGYKTKEQYDEWRQKAERYAQEFSLQLNNKTPQEADDDELSSAISLSEEQRIEALVYEFTKQYGFNSPQEAWTAIENSYYSS